MKKHLYTIVSLVLGSLLYGQVCLNPASGSPFTAAQQPFSITTADFNSDSKADLVTADRNNNTVSVVFGTGTGSFTSTTTFSVGSAPISVTSADFNGDSFTDLAVVNNASSNVSILLGNGAGGFSAPVNYPVGTAPFSVTSADFNGDTFADLAVANNSSNSVSILLGNGAGNFSAAVNFTVGTGPISVISADFNGDTFNDLATANYTSNNVSVLIGNGAGSFASAVNFTAGTGPRSIIKADFNADGNPDLATANDGSNNASVLLGNGAGSFASAVIFAVGTNPYSITSGDFNSDSFTDLATANINSNNVSVLFGNGIGSFASAINFNVGSTVRAVTRADLNADGKDDLATANFISLSIFLNETPSVTANTTSSVVCAGTNITLTGGGATTYTWSGGVSDGVSFIPFTTTSYTVTGTDGNGCTNTAVKNIIVNPLPIANAGLDQTLTCASLTVSLIGSASPSSCTPVWTGGVTTGVNSYTATTSTAGDYTLTVTNPTNGCSGTDQVQVSANASIPTITITVSNILTCSAPNATTSAISTATLPTYLWSGPSVMSGATSANAIVDQPGVYTVTVTDIPTGCSATASINVTQDTAIPNITVAVSSSAICSGSSSTLNANSSADPNVNYAWLPGFLNGSIQNVSPLSTTLYSVVSTNTINGCASTETVNITVYATPILSVSGDLNICKGSATNLTAIGATSYTWDSGANTSLISVTPTITTTYTVDGMDGNGCSNSLPITVSIISNKSITGIITSTTGATGGDVILYKYTAALSHWDSLTITPIGGTYSFNNIDSGLYVLRAIPTATNIQVTYAFNAVSWQSAAIITHGCTNNSSQNIDLIGLTPFAAGPGVLTGVITEGNGYVPKISNEFKPLVPGTPIGGLVVKGGKNPGGQMLVQTTTNAQGQYTLTGLPLNTGTDSYFIFVDIPGLDTNGTYHLVVATGNTQFNNLNFYVDSVYIYPNSVTYVKDEYMLFDNKISVFPNPAKETVSIQYELIQSANVQIELFDIVGNKIESVLKTSYQEKNKYTHKINTRQLGSGIYLIKLRINNSENMIKVIVTE